MFVPCPVCGADDAIQIVYDRWTDGEPPWTAQRVSLQAVPAGECDCDLSEEQLTAIEASVSLDDFDAANEPYLGPFGEETIGV